MSQTATPSNRTLRLLGAGLIASLVMGMWEMMAEALLPHGAGFWSAPTYIAATVFRGLQSVARPVPFDPMAVVAGLMGHMMNSVILGLVFGFGIAPRLKSIGSRIMAGMVFGGVIYAVMAFAVAPFVDPAMGNLNAMAFLLGHLMWGGALGALIPQVAKA